MKLSLLRTNGGMQLYCMVTSVVPGIQVIFFYFRPENLVKFMKYEDLRYIKES